MRGQGRLPCHMMISDADERPRRFYVVPVHNCSCSSHLDSGFDTATSRLRSRVAKPQHQNRSASIVRDGTDVASLQYPDRFLDLLVDASRSDSERLLAHIEHVSKIPRPHHLSVCILDLGAYLAYFKICEPPETMANVLPVHISALKSKKTRQPQRSLKYLWPVHMRGLRPPRNQPTLYYLGYPPCIVGGTMLTLYHSRNGYLNS